jgi:hypothetical protein
VWLSVREDANGSRGAASCPAAAAVAAGWTTIATAALVRLVHHEPRVTPGRCPPTAYGDATFDAAYRVTVLGEVPNQEAALRELRLLRKPDWRLIVGELFRIGPRSGYFGLLHQGST